MSPKKILKQIYVPILILLGGNVVILTKNLFALLLFEGICHSNSQNKSISLQ
jgi:hypothetical protein